LQIPERVDILIVQVNSVVEVCLIQQTGVIPIGNHPMLKNDIL
jgi:hypothetical protein